MSTAIFFCVPLHGHVTPSLAVISELTKRGERVFYYATAEFQAPIEAAGAVFCDYGPLDFTNQHFSDNPIEVVCSIVNLVHPLLDRCLSEARALQPDYIMHDVSAVWGRFIAELLSVPSVGSEPSLILTPEVTASMPLQTLRPLLCMFEARALLASTNKKLALLADTYSVSKLSVPTTMTSFGDRTLVYMFRQFQPRQQLFGDHFAFIGPSIAHRETSSSFPFERLTARPTIYISLGTLFNDHLAFFRLCLQAFADDRFQVVMAVGRRINIADLGPIPAHFIVQPSVPQVAILSRCSLFISHGGLNSVMEALYYGVPMLLLPSKGGDQPWIALRAQQIGAGKILRYPRLTPKRLRRSVENILSNPAFAQASMRAGEALRSTGGAAYACDMIEQLKREKGISTDPILSLDLDASI